MYNTAVKRRVKNLANQWRASDGFIPGAGLSRNHRRGLLLSCKYRHSLHTPSPARKEVGKTREKTRIELWQSCEHCQLHAGHCASLPYTVDTIDTVDTVDCGVIHVECISCFLCEEIWAPAQQRSYNSVQTEKRDYSTLLKYWTGGLASGRWKKQGWEENVHN